MAHPSQTLDDESFRFDEFPEKFKRAVPFEAPVHEDGKQAEQRKGQGVARVNLKMKGPALGIIKHAEYEQRIYKIQPGDKLLFYTDGIIEQRNDDGEMFSESRLRQSFLKLARKNEGHILKHLETILKQYTSTYNKDDDITMLLLEFV